MFIGTTQIAGISAGSYRFRYSGSDWWYSVQGDGNTVSITANQVIAMPLPVDIQATFKGLAVRVQATGSTAELGIYRDTGAGYPSDLISQTVGTIDTSTTETKTTSFTPTVLSAGLYWVACMALTSTTTFHTVAAGTYGELLPHSNSATPDLQFTLPGYWDGAGSGALPATWPAARSKVNRAPVFAIRVA